MREATASERLSEDSTRAEPTVGTHSNFQSTGTGAYCVIAWLIAE
jgi:hypothetical protein